MKFRADEIASVLREEIARYHREIDVAQVGRVLEVGDEDWQSFGVSGIVGSGDNRLCRLSLASSFLSRAWFQILRK